MEKFKPNLLHIISDEKFPDYAYRQFEIAGLSNDTYILPSGKKNIRFVKEIKPNRISRFSFLSNKFIKSLEDYDAVILHSLTEFSLEVMKRANNDIVFVWIGMGFDYYDLLYKSKSDFLEPNTKKLLENDNSINRKDKIKGLFKNLIRSIVYSNSKNKQEIIKKVSIFSPVLYSEFKALKSSLDCFPAEYVKWNYGSQSDLIDSKESIGYVKGRNILVGNSASPNNNHIEVFLFLSKLGLPKDVNIVVPLSYGDSSYRKKIIKEGEKIFGNRFKPITDFLSFKSYIEVLISCPIVIMNHKRQQGAGNIGIALFLGAKIFMHPDSMLLEEHMTNGLTVFSINSLKNELAVSFDGLDKLRAEANREYLRNEKGFYSHVENTRVLINRISQISRVKS